MVCYAPLSTNRFSETNPPPNRGTPRVHESSEEDEESSEEESSEDSSEGRPDPDVTDHQPGPVPLNPSEVRWQERDRRRRLLNDHQVLASAHFVRRIQLFMRYIVNHKSLLCGTLKDYIIRYETQGRGSVHAHMLWWIDIDPQYIGPADTIELPDELLERFALVKEKTDGERVKLFNETFLSYTNANIWAMQKVEHIKNKLRIGLPDYETLR